MADNSSLLYLGIDFIAFTKGIAKVIYTKLTSSERNANINGKIVSD